MITIQDTMNSFEANFKHPNVSIYDEINEGVMTRSISSDKWEHALNRLRTISDLDCVCILWHHTNDSSYWLMRGEKHYIIRIIMNGRIVYQKPWA
jgi:RecA-family ATPase